MGMMMVDREALYQKMHKAAINDFLAAYAHNDVSDGAFGIGDEEDAGLIGCNLKVLASRKWATATRTSWSFEHYVNGKKTTSRMFLQAIPA